jgi:hypothetical protein
MAEWGRTDDNYNTRVGHFNGDIGGGLNGGYLLTPTTVHAAASDTLFGEDGSDWFFAKLSGSNQDKVKDQSGSEIVTAI